ncbi:MAG TPA: hypothetical protein VHK47_17635 [Polyangia bacterium]|jgi:hypothetical protein|nr:hypothetical protein [Polyangia bacterium]
MASPKWFERDLLGDTSAHEGAGWLWLVSSSKAAATKPATLTGAAMAIVAAVLTGLPALLLLMPVSFTVFLALGFLSGKTRQLALRRARAMPIELPPLTAFTDPRARILLERLGRSRDAVRDALDAAPRRPGFDLEPALARVPDLERQVVVIASRIEYVARFVSTTAASCLRADSERLRERARDADDDTRVSFQRAADRSQSHFESLLALQGQGERLVAMAEEALATLEELPVMITTVQLRRFEACDGNTDARIAETTTDLVEGMRALAQTLGEPEPSAQR